MFALDASSMFEKVETTECFPLASDDEAVGVAARDSGDPDVPEYKTRK